MGTSVSQPSPSTGPGSKKWKEVQEGVSFGNFPADKIFDAVKDAFKNEYGDHFSDVLIDKGVTKIESLVTDFSSNTELPKSAEFIIRGRELLSQEKANSFLAELALTKAASCAEIANKEERTSTFICEYLSGVVDYAVSRDLPEIIGDIGISNISRLEVYLKEINNSVKDMKLKSLKEAFK